MKINNFKQVKEKLQIIYSKLSFMKVKDLTILKQSVLNGFKI